MKLLRNRHGVSHQIGFMLTLALTSIIIAVTILTTNTLIDEKARDAAQIHGENIANKVASAIINMIDVKEQYPNANYSLLLDIPFRLVNRFSYHIDITNDAVYVISNEVSIDASCSLYNVTKKHGIEISGTVYGDERVINISCDSYDVIYDFDFGTPDSEGNSIRITNNCSKTDNEWTEENWNYRVPIIIKNPVIDDGPLTDYQVLVKLDDSNFDHSLADDTGSDIIFRDQSGNYLPFWIERWYPRDTHTSRIWVKVPSISDVDDTLIYMYYGRDDYYSSQSNGTDTFCFFDNFTTDGTPDTDKWVVYEKNPGQDEVYNEDGFLILRNGSAINTTHDYLYGDNPVVIETKAKSEGDRREASMFARNYDSVATPPYVESYILTSTANLSNDDRNFSLVLDNTTVEDTEYIPVSSGWNRLTYIINDTNDPLYHTLICRYFYENYTLNARILHSGLDTADYRDDDKIGLCTTEALTTAFYDWIYVRKYRANLSNSITSLEDSIPTAYVNGTDSQDFYWDDTSNVDSGETDVGSISYDYVCSNSNNAPGTFRIKNIGNFLGLEDTDTFSILLTIGNPDRAIDDMEITINNGVEQTVFTEDCESYKKILIRNIDVEPGNDLTFTFDDTDGDYYWVAGDILIQRGNRIIDIDGGYS